MSGPSFSSRRLVLLSAAVLALALPGGGALASPSVRLTIRHVVAHCHVWALKGKALGPRARLVVAPGTRLQIRPDCPMDFDVVQIGGPRLRLGARRIYAGTTRSVAFRRTGVYRLRVTNVQTPEERGLVTIGATNTLLLTVVVR